MSLHQNLYRYEISPLSQILLSYLPTTGEMFQDFRRQFLLENRFLHGRIWACQFGLSQMIVRLWSGAVLENVQTAFSSNQKSSVGYNHLSSHHPQSPEQSPACTACCGHQGVNVWWTFCLHHASPGAWPDCMSCSREGSASFTTQFGLFQPPQHTRSTVLGNGPTKILKYLYPGFFFECFEDEMRKRKVPDSSSALRDHQLLSPCSTCPALWTLLGLFSQMLVLSGTHLAFGVHLPRREPSCHTSSSRHFLSACFRGDCKLGDSFLWFLL